MFVQLQRVETELRDVAELDLHALTATEVVRVLNVLATIRRLTDGVIAHAAKRADDLHAHMVDGQRNTTTLLANTLGVGCTEARSAIETGQRLEALPETAAAVRRGELSAKQAALITEAASVNPDAEARLLKTADQGLVPLKEACTSARCEAEDAAERSARQHKARSFRMWTEADGMVHGKFALAPEIGAQLKARIDKQVQRTFRARRKGEHEPHEAYAADALAKFALGSTEDGDAEPVDATVHVLIDHDALKRGDARPGETCEIAGVGPVNAQWVRSILGDAFVTSIIKDGVDIKTVSHHGRHINAVLRTALLAMGRECDIVGCNVRGYLEIDHEHDYAKGGPTELANLGYECAPHHGLKSKGWILGPRDPITRKRTLRPPPGSTSP